MPLGLSSLQPQEQELSEDDRWHRHFHAEGRQGQVYWRGVQTVKHPMDLMVFAEIIHQVMPRVIIETGTRTGGSALFFADMMTIAGVPNPRVVTVDTARDENLAPLDPRIVYLTGSSLDEEILDEVHQLAWNRWPCMVTLDSDHSAAHVYSELDAYMGWVSPGSYLIVEDTNLGSPVDSDYAVPAVALEKWLPDHPEFQPDRFRERFGVTFNPGGWLRRVS